MSTGWRTKGICGQIPTISRWSRRPQPPPFCLAGKRSLCLCAWRISPRARRRAKKRRKRKKQSCGFGACARGEHRPVFRPQGRADADRAGGERAGLSRLYQRSPYGYGRQKTPYHGGISGGLRRRREKSGTVWSGIPEGHRRL